MHALAKFRECLVGIKFCIKIDHNSLKHFLGQWDHNERQYSEGLESAKAVCYMVYLMLHPSRQSSIRKSGDEELKPRYYGPFYVVRCMSEVDY